VEQEWHVTPSEPEPFDVMPITYDNAFGGGQFLRNPVGRGYARSNDGIDGQPLPNTEEPGKRITDPAGEYVPMSFGSIGRNWAPRFRHAGTYDQEWLEERAPFWPTDFDYRYFQAAPPEQQIPPPRGGEEVVLENLTPGGYVSFRLPVRPMPVWFIQHQGKDVRVDGVIDTILIEPDLGRFTLTWRASLAMRKSCFDLEEVIAGDMPVAWQRARKYGNKPYYHGLAELVRAKRRRG
jgi:hypothetical protein